MDDIWTRVYNVSDPCMRAILTMVCRKLNLTTNKSVRTLSMCFYYDYRNLIQFFIKTGSKVQKIDILSSTSLKTFKKYGGTTEMISDEQRNRMIVNCIRFNKPKFLKYLVGNRHVDVNIILKAICNDRLRCFQILAEGFSDEYIETASMYNSLHILRYFKQNNKITPVVWWYAVRPNNEKLLSWLLRNKINITEDAVYASAEIGDLEKVKYYITQTTYNRDRLYTIARMNKRIDIINYLSG